MTTPGEFGHRTPVHLRIGELFRGIVALEHEAHISPLFLDLETIRLLQPSFPEIEDWQLAAPIFEKQTFDRASWLSRLVLKAIRLTPQHSNTPSLSFSQTFITKRRAVRGTPRDADPWVWLNISETNYGGTITVNSQEFEFDANQPVIRASSNWLNSDGRQVESGITYMYVPHRNYIESSPSQEGIGTLPYVNRDADQLENLRSIVEAAFRIKSL